MGTLMSVKIRIADYIDDIKGGDDFHTVLGNGDVLMTDTHFDAQKAWAESAREQCQGVIDTIVNSYEFEGNTKSLCIAAIEDLCRPIKNTNLLLLSHIIFYLIHLSFWVGVNTALKHIKIKEKRDG